MNGDHAKPRQRLILAYVWRRWSDGRLAHLQGMAAAAGYASAPGNAIVRASCALVEGGMLTQHREGRSRGYAPGPRFGGLDRAGQPYQVVA